MLFKVNRELLWMLDPNSLPDPRGYPGFLAPAIPPIPVPPLTKEYISLRDSIIRNHLNFFLI